MDVFIFIMIFIGGTVFGSFYTLAVYRLPRKENITYVQSHCVSCNHKLGPLDLIPIFSYLFLGGKCRYCKEKIRSRYVLLEIMSGLAFLLLAIIFGINTYSTLTEFINLFITYLFITSVFITAGIDKENYTVLDNVLLYGIGISILKIIFKSYCGKFVLTNILGFLIIPVLVLFMNYCFKEKNKFKLDFSYIKYLALIGLYFGIELQVFMLISSIILILLSKFFLKITKVPVAFYMSVATILVMMISELSL